MVKRTSLDDFGHSQTVAIVVPVKEQSERGRTLAGCRGVVAAAGMRHVKLAEQLRQEIGEVVVVVDMGQELAVGFGHGFPVDTVHVFLIEASCFLLLYIVEHVFAFGLGVDFHCGRIFDGLYCLRGHAHFAEAVGAEQVQGVAILVGLY